MKVWTTLRKINICRRLSLISLNLKDQILIKLYLNLQTFNLYDIRKSIGIYFYIISKYQLNRTERTNTIKTIRFKTLPQRKPGGACVVNSRLVHANIRMVRILTRLLKVFESQHKIQLSGSSGTNIMSESASNSLIYVIFPHIQQCGERYSRMKIVFVVYYNDSRKSETWLKSDVAGVKDEM